MTAIGEISIDPAVGVIDAWQAVAQQAQAWADINVGGLRDVIVLVPQVQMLPVARRAFAAPGGWQPRIETAQTLARSLGPDQPADPQQLRFDIALDRVAAARLLRRQGLATGMREPAAFDQLVSALVQTAQTLALAAAAVPPRERPTRASEGRALLGAVNGLGGRERLLARLAFEWAQASAVAATDALFELAPAAWVVVQAGGTDALADALLAAAAGAGVPALRIDTDGAAADPIPACAVSDGLSVSVCADVEGEAQQCAAQVIAQLNAGRSPVALIAQDRLLVRRVRALLARHAVPVVDETGWRLSTTRAGALLAALLRAAAPLAATDDWLDWLKAGRTSPAALQALESTLRRHGWARADDVTEARLPDGAAALWRSARDTVAAVDADRARPLAGWLDALRDALQSCGAWPQLLADDAGRQLVAALHLGDDRPALADDPLTLAAFSRWVDAVLEAAPFRPAPAGVADGARVIVTPLEQAVLRPFGAVVFPAADARRLGAPAAPQPLLDDGLAVALGLRGAAALREAEVRQFAQLLRCPQVTFLRRVDDGGEPLAASPLLERLNLARLEVGLGAVPVAPDARAALQVPLQPVRAPLPVAPGLLPDKLSASACEALRACPYRFFALRLLRLDASEELDDAVEKRDYGNWLHEVLNRFHRRRGEGGRAAEDDTTHLQATADDVRREQALDDATFLPFGASFARLVPAYVAWLQARDADGAQWLDGELRLTAHPPEWQGIEMQGVIDRVDSVDSGSAVRGVVTQLIDYKTGSAQSLARSVANPQEDTQLAFYAALMLRQGDAPGGVTAAYLPLDAGEEVRLIEHDDVEATAELLVEGLGRDFAQIRAGAPLPALGEGRACDHCDARGLCRRDHWTADPAGTT